MTYELAFDLIPDSVNSDVSARSSTFPRRQRMSPPRSFGMERQTSQPVLTHVEYAAWNERRAASLSAATGARIAAALVPGGGGASRSNRQRGGRARGSVMNLFPSPVPEAAEEMSYPQAVYPSSPMDVEQHHMQQQHHAQQPQPPVEAAYIQPVDYQQFQQLPPTPPLAHTLSPSPATPATIRSSRPSLSRSSTGTTTSFYNHDDYNYELPPAFDDAATIRPQPVGVPQSPKADIWPAPRQPSVQDMPQTPSPCQSGDYAYPSPVASPPYVQYQQPTPVLQASPSFANPRQHPPYPEPAMPQHYLAGAVPQCPVPPHQQHAHHPHQLQHPHQLPQQQQIHIGEHYS